MGNTRLKKRRLSKKPSTSSKVASSSKKITLKISKPVSRSKSQPSTQPRALALFEDENELEGDMDLYVSPPTAGYGGSIEDEDDEDVLQESEIEEMEEMEMGEEMEMEMGEEMEESGGELVGSIEQEQKEDLCFDMPFHIPLGIGKDAEVKTLDLRGNNNFQYFRVRVSNTMKIDRANLHLSYRFSNAKSNDPYHVLECRDDWERLVKEFSQRRKRVRKGSLPLSIWVKVKVDGMDEVKKPAKRTQKGKGQKPKSKVLSDDSDESEGDKDNGDWRIHRQLREKYGKCNDHPEKICYVTNDGIHHILTHANCSAWVTLVKAGKASLDVPPDELRITDRPVKPRGVSGPNSAGPSEVAMPPGMFGGPAAFGIAMASFVQHVKGAGGVLSSSQPAPSASKKDGENMDDLAADPDFPPIRDWLASIQDIHPRLVTYVDILEERQLTHLNQLDSHDMSVAALVGIGMGFLDASVFLRMGRQASKEFREIFKK